VFGYRDVLIAGAFDQTERAGMFLCHPPYLPLSSRGDVVVFRSEILKAPLDVTGMVVVQLIIASTCVDTDFTAKLIDEYPPNNDYPRSDLHKTNGRDGGRRRQRGAASLRPLRYASVRMQTRSRRCCLR
jgi:predicted acyl esterase